MKSTKKSLLFSVLSLILCVVMLLGTTYAWFTDTVTNSNNRIVAGNLKVDLIMSDSYNGTYSSIASGTGSIFDSAGNANSSNKTLWEPGATHIAYLGVQNKGNLALKYNIYLDVTDNGLAGALEYAIVPFGKSVPTADITDWADAKAKATAVSSELTGDVTSGRKKAAPSGCLDEIANDANKTNETDYFALVVHMKEDAGNEYQGKDIVIDVNIVATQYNAESDSFDNDYDENATYPTLAPFINLSTSKAGKFAKVDNTNKYVKTNEEVKIEDNTTSTTITSTVPTGTQIYKSVNNNDVAITTTNTADTFNGELTRNIKTTSATENSVTYDISYVYSETVNNVKTSVDVSKFGSPVTNVINLSAGLKDVKVTHSHGNSTTVMTAASSKASIADGQYFYDVATGELTIYSALYSDFIVSYDYDFVSSIGSVGFNTLAEAFAAVKDGETIYILNDCETGSTYTMTNPLVLTAENVTLDLNGNTITTTNNFTFVIAGNNDIIKNGTIKSHERRASDGNTATDDGPLYRGYPLVVASMSNAGSVTGVQVNNVTIYGGISAGGSIENNVTNIKGAGNVTLTDCTIKEGAAYALYAQLNSTLTVVSGDYYNGHSGLAYAESGSTISITGGTFSSDPTAYVASGYIAEANGTTPETWTVRVNFAGGTGTESDPFLISNADEFKNITNFSNEYHYYKIADGVTTIDMLGHGSIRQGDPINLCGSFDGNNVTFKNLGDNNLINNLTTVDNKVCTLKNFTLDESCKTEASYGAGIVNNSMCSVDFVNVKNYSTEQISVYFGGSLIGQVEGENAHINVENCTLNPIIIDTSNQHYIGGYFGTIISTGITVSIRNSSFDGKIYMGATSSTGAYKYAGHCHNVPKITVDEVETTDSLLDTTGNNAKVFTTLKTVIPTINATNKCFEFTKESNATKALVTFEVRANQGNVKGLCMVKQKFTIDISEYSDNSQIDCSTDKLGYFSNIKLNSGDTYANMEIYDDVLYLHMEEYDAGSAHNAAIYVVQYDAEGNVIAVGTLSLAGICEK